MPDILVAGETLVDFIPRSDAPLPEVEQFERRAGGAPANVAVRLAQLGEPPWFWTRLADDPFGTFLRATLEEHGIPDRFVEHDATARTPLAFVSDQQFSFYRDGTADTRMQAGTVPDETLRTVDWVAAGGVALASEPARSAILDLLDRAQTHDCTVVFDPNARPECWRPGEFERVLARALRSVDLVVATPADLHAGGLSGEESTLAESVFERGPHTLVVTRGAAGSTAYQRADAPWSTAENKTSHEGYSVDAVDTTGAGDAFLAGLLRGLADGERNLAELLAVGNAVGAMATTRTGGTSALPYDGDVEAFRPAHAGDDDR